ncbi:MAG: DUF1697 domain-containing protein [Ilumatobacter sp.]
MNNSSFVFVRAINTGARRLSNDEQIAPLLAAGFRDVAAYQAAGNLVVGPGVPDESVLDDLLGTAYGFDVVTFVRTADELEQCIASQPFDDAHIAATAGRIQVTFLRREPTAAQIAEVEAVVPDEDAVRFAGRVWYWLPLDGVSTSSLPVAHIERIVGPMTMRTLGTVERLLAKFT